MPIKVKKAGVYTDPVGVFAKKNGVYSAIAGLSVKVGGAYALASSSALATPLGVVFDGDSITQGIGNNTASYPAQFATNTGQSINNMGNSGDTIATMSSTYAATIAPLYNASTKNTLVVNGGTNDIGNDAQNAAQVQARITSYCALGRATGFKVITSTITPRSDAGWDGTKEGFRVAYNTWLRANFASISDGLIDFDSALTGTDLNNTFLWQDKLHPQNTISRVMAELVRTRFGLAYIPNDTTPAAFAFADITGATLSTLYTSAALIPNAFDAPAAITVTGGSYVVNGGAATSAAGIFNPWDNVQAQCTSSSSNSTATNVAVTIGGVSDTYTVTTAAASAVFNPTPLNGTYTTSNGNRTVSGMTATATALSAIAMTGKRVFAVTMDAGANTNYPLVGVASGAATASSLFASATSLANLCNIGQIWTNGSSVSSSIAVTTNGATIAMAVDTSNKRIWFTADGTNWYGGGFSGAIATSQVIAGTGFQSFSTAIPGATVYAAVGASDTAGKGFTIVPYPWTMPSGFTQF